MENLMDKPVIDIIKDIPKRFVLLISKIVGVKVAIFGCGTWLLLTDKISEWAWLILAGIVIFGREFLKFMKDIR